MRRYAFAVVAVLVLLSGCNTLGGNPTVERPVTAVDVPDVGAPATPTSTLAERDCLAPRPATPTSPTPTPPTEPVEFPRDNGSVDGSTLVDQHVRALSNHSYHLQVGDDTEVWAIADAAAFTYEGVDLGISASDAYAVGGTMYTLDEDSDGRLVLRREPYREGSPTSDRQRSSLTGQYWLAQRIGFYNYEFVETRTWNGTAVRVFRDTVDGPTLLGPDGDGSGAYTLNSTVYVDRRGVVRYVRHVRDIEYEKISDLPNRTEVDSFRVDGVGTTRVSRPSAFCVSDLDTVRMVGTDVGPLDRTTPSTETDWATGTAPTGSTETPVTTTETAVVTDTVAETMTGTAAEPSPPANGTTVPDG